MERLLAATLPLMLVMQILSSYANIVILCFSASKDINRFIGSGKPHLRKNSRITIIQCLGTFTWKFPGSHIHNTIYWNQSCVIDSRNPGPSKISRQNPIRRSLRRLGTLRSGSRWTFSQDLKLIKMSLLKHLQWPNSKWPFHVFMLWSSCVIHRSPMVEVTLESPTLPCWALLQYHQPVSLRARFEEIQPFLNLAVELCLVSGQLATFKLSNLTNLQAPKPGQGGGFLTDWPLIKGLFT